jgi:hypothetical protein
MSSHQATNYLESLIENTQTHLGVTNLNNLPTLPQGKNLQSLINFFNNSQSNNSQN